MFHACRMGPDLAACQFRVCRCTGAVSPPVAPEAPGARSSGASGRYRWITDGLACKPVKVPLCSHLFGTTLNDNPNARYVLPVSEFHPSNVRIAVRVRGVNAVRACQYAAPRTHLR